MENQTDRAKKAPDAPLVWNPWIRALGWLLSFMFTSFCAAVVWNVAAGVGLQFGSLVARTIWILFVLILCSGLLIVFDLWTASLTHAWRNYGGWPMVVVGAVVTLLFLMIAAAYVWLVSWPLAYVWPILQRVGALFGTQVEHGGSMAVPEWLSGFLLGGISVAAFGWVSYSLKHTWLQVRDAVRLLGMWRAARGAMLMFVLRHRLPRRDLFLLSPVLSVVPLLALSAWMSTTIETSPFTWLLPLLVLLLAVSHCIDMLAPPLWLYLGPSDFSSFASFYRLRSTWRKNGLTLLNRLGSDGRDFYAAWRSRMPASSLFYDPTVPRAWSMRTRDEAWEATVLNMMDYVLLVVVDVRGESEIVREEIEWLHLRLRLNRAWFIAAGEAGVSDEARQAAIGRYPSLDPTRLVSEDELAAARWTRAGSGGQVIEFGA